jgi:hypothetical protein
VEDQLVSRTLELELIQTILCEERCELSTGKVCGFDPEDFLHGAVHLLDHLCLIADDNPIDQFNVVSKS